MDLLYFCVVLNLFRVPLVILQFTVSVLTKKEYTYRIGVHLVDHLKRRMIVIFIYSTIFRHRENDCQSFSLSFIFQLVHFTVHSTLWCEYNLVQVLVY